MDPSPTVPVRHERVTAAEGLFIWRYVFRTYFTPYILTQILLLSTTKTVFNLNAFEGNKRFFFYCASLTSQHQDRFQPQSNLRHQAICPTCYYLLTTSHKDV